MQYTVNLLKKRADWADKVKFVALSIDQFQYVVQKYVKGKGWEQIDHWFQASSDCK